MPTYYNRNTMLVRLTELSADRGATFIDDAEVSVQFETRTGLPIGDAMPMTPEGSGGAYWVIPPDDLDFGDRRRIVAHYVGTTTDERVIDIVHPVFAEDRTE